MSRVLAAAITGPMLGLLAGAGAEALPRGIWPSRVPGYLRGVVGVGAGAS